LLSQSCPQIGSLHRPKERARGEFRHFSSKYRGNTFPDKLYIFKNSEWLETLFEKALKPRTSYCRYLNGTVWYLNINYLTEE